jgi:hypothetical protein
MKKQKFEPCTETKMPKLNAMTLFAFRVFILNILTISSIG